MSIFRPVSLKIENQVRTWRPDKLRRGIGGWMYEVHCEKFAGNMPELKPEQTGYEISAYPV